MAKTSGARQRAGAAAVGVSMSQMVLVAVIAFLVGKFLLPVNLPIKA